jgi:hypothetical protein
MMSIVSSFYSKKQVSTQHKQTYITHKVVASVLALCCGSVFLYTLATQFTFLLVAKNGAVAQVLSALVGSSFFICYSLDK